MRILNSEVSIRDELRRSFFFFKPLIKSGLDFTDSFAYMDINFNHDSFTDLQSLTVYDR